MPLNVEELLQPIPGDNPSGQDLRYDPIYEKIKEARREDVDAPQGKWEVARKVAEWPLVISLITPVISTKSKDLQLAVWLTEALLKKEGFGGLRSGMELVRSLLDKFWDTLYPEIEDGEAELRAAPLTWMGLKLDIAIKSVPLVRAGHDFFKYNESQLLVGYEATLEGDSKKIQARNILINEEGKLSGEEWDKAFEETPKAFYKQEFADLDASLKLVAAIDDFGDKFGDFAPGYGTLRKTLEEVQHAVKGLLQQKLAIDPDPVEETPAASSEEGAAATGEGGAPGGAPMTAEPTSRDDAANRVVAVARYLRKLEPSNPAAYLMLRGFRWGEVRASKGKLEPRLLIAPPTALRSQLKLLLLDGKWEALLEAGEGAMGQPCGRGWLDLQRYVIVASSKLGHNYEAVETALRDALRAYLAEVPEIAEVTMMDDTPTANSETRAWIAEDLNTGGPEPIPQEEQEGTAADGDDGGALGIAKSGRTEEAVALLKSQLALERTLRGKFRRRTQLAAILVEAGQDTIAQPILEDLVGQIDNYKLEEWESGEMVAEPLALLYRVLHKLEADPDTRNALYLRICRLDAMQALRCPQ
jgi:type VI secretion system protein ImpA